MRTVLAALCFAALPALAEEPPVPQLFRGIGQAQGQWRMEILEMEGRGRSMQGGMPAMTLCTDNLFREAQARQRQRSRGDCTHRLLKDTPDEMLMESECPDGASRILMQREGAKSLLMQGEVKDRRGTSTMKMRYTYEGACQAGSGAPALRFDKDSEACRQMRAQLAQLDPAKSCARSAQRAECEARARAAAEQAAALCR
ncbi:MAG TPA: hypothetical protein VFV84_04620 [Burkholderiales bacterium]|nr:hypothetical protein [Burkholderiales bacterium]